MVFCCSLKLGTENGVLGESSEKEFRAPKYKCVYIILLSCRFYHILCFLCILYCLRFTPFCLVAAVENLARDLLPLLGELNRNGYAFTVRAVDHTSRGLCLVSIISPLHPTVLYM